MFPYPIWQITNVGGVDIGDNIASSIMLDSSASQYLSRTFTTSATFTFACIFKRGKLGQICPLLDTSITFNADDTLTAFGLTTTSVYRDPTSWLFIHVSNGGLYVNGVSQGSVTTSALTNPRMGFDGTNYADGYMAMCYLVDGTSSAYTNYGRVSTDTAEWVNKNASPTYGVHGSLLAFATGAALGTDTSGNGNNWTLNGGITSANQYTDTPTNNFAAWNPLNSDASAVFSVGNTKATTPSTNDRAVTSSIAIPRAGKWAMKVTPASHISNWIGITNIQKVAADINTAGANSVLYYANGNKWVNGTNSAYGASYTTEQIEIVVDSDAGTATFWKGAVSQGAITLPSSSIDYCFVVANAAGASLAMQGDFGAKGYTSNVAGAKALCTANLTSETVTVSGTFTGNAAADGPFVFCNGYPTTLTINSNAVTFGTHADRTAGGFKLRTASSSYNASGSNTWTATIVSNRNNCLKYANAQENP